jgi:hypothetical protein
MEGSQPASTDPITSQPASQRLEHTLAPMGDPGIKKIVIAIHGIGDQYQNATVRSVVSIFGRCFDQATPVPLGGFYSADGSVQVFRATPPPSVKFPMSAIGFVEAYWADIPRRVQRRGYTIEETRGWARTVVERVQAQYQDELNQKLALNSSDYLSAIAALEGMIDAIGVLGNLFFLAEKAGFAKFELENMLTAFVGDVQIVADFSNYRDRIRRQVWNILEKVHAKNKEAELYIVAHSEGTVVALVAILKALSKPNGDPDAPATTPAWIKQLRGLMTIGSPIDKHLILWRKMWDDLKNPDPDLQLPQPIRWRNYYDYADPVGFNLDTARDWLRDHNWKRFFEFEDEHDHGFGRYFLPGKAHNDYWNDPYVFGHFISEVVGLSPVANGAEIKGPPETRKLATLSSYFTPYLLIAVVLFFAVYFLYTGVNTYLSMAEHWTRAARHIAALACLLAGTTVASRILCLTRHPHWKRVSVLCLALLAGAYVALMSGANLWTPLAEWTWVAATVCFSIGAVFLAVLCDRKKAFLQRWPPIRLFARGMRPLLIAGGLATVALAIHQIRMHPEAATKSAWPLLLSGAAFLYLWWLTAILFDLIFTWQRYIRGAVWQIYLRQARKDRIMREENGHNNSVVPTKPGAVGTA